MLFGRECETGEHRQRMKTWDPNYRDKKTANPVAVSYEVICVHTSTYIFL